MSKKEKINPVRSKSPKATATPLVRTSNRVKKPYEGHRERLRQRFEKSGFQGFQDYEVLELLLTFVLPRIDTKPVARELLDRFKNLTGVLNADAKDLQQVKGIKERSAQFLNILSATITYYFQEKAKTEQIQFTNLNDLVTYLKAVLSGKKNEVMYILYLNSQNKLIHSETLSEGTVSETVVLPRKIVENALKHNATTVIISHNHPSGLPEPSDKDNTMTEQVKNALQTVNITLQEHIIISDDGFYSYRKNGILS